MANRTIYVDALIYLYIKGTKLTNLTFCHRFFNPMLYIFPSTLVLKSFHLQ